MVRVVKLTSEIHLVSSIVNVLADLLPPSLSLSFFFVWKHLRVSCKHHYLELHP